jgi:predicted secreted protein
MFNDKRNKKIILTAHCLMNQNSISDGTADFPSQFDKVINLLMTHKIGIIQLPCPELICLGLDRQNRDNAGRELLLENTRIRCLLDKKEHQKILKNKAKEIVTQIEEYKKYDFKIVGIIGVNRSPSCGIETTTINGEETKGRGIFMRIIEEEFGKRGLKIRMIGSKTCKEKESVKMIKKFIEE